MGRKDCPPPPQKPPEMNGNAAHLWDLIWHTNTRVDSLSSDLRSAIMWVGGLLVTVLLAVVAVLVVVLLK